MGVFSKITCMYLKLSCSGVIFVFTLGLFFYYLVGFWTILQFNKYKYY
jgi:hypothetical protein